MKLVDTNFVSFEILQDLFNVDGVKLAALYFYDSSVYGNNFQKGQFYISLCHAIQNKLKSV